MVAQRVIELTSGIGALHEMGALGAGVRIGVLDAQVGDPLNEAFIEETLVVRPRRKKPPGGRTHADQMLDVLRLAAPQAKVVLAEVAEGDGLIFRPSVVSGLAAMEDRRVDVVLLSIEIGRDPVRCTPDGPCGACVATNRIAASTIVIVAAGNTGERGFTCPAAEASKAIVVIATLGPRDNDSAEGEGVSGTSVSAALTAGGVALLASLLPDLETREVEEALRATGTKLGDPTVVRSHFFRACRYIEHARRGGTADEALAQRIVDEHRALLAAVQSGESDSTEPLVAIDFALQFAPWSADLHGVRASLISDASPGEGLNAITEAIRLDWESAWLHRQLGGQLDALGLSGAQIERDIAAHLDAGEVGRAARALDRGLHQSAR